MIEDSTVDNKSEDKIRHFSIPLTKKYTAYSCIVLPPGPYPMYAVLIIKVRNHEDNSEHGIWELSHFFTGYLNKDLSMKKGFIAKDLNDLLHQSEEYLISKKFTDDEIEKYIREIEEEVKHSHRKIIEDSMIEFKEIFSSSYLANTPTEKILKDHDIK